MSDIKIEAEIEKLNKQKSTVLNALKILVRDHGKVEVKIQLMGEEYLTLNKQLRVLRSSQTKIVSFEDVQRIKKLIKDVKDKLEYDHKQLLSIESFIEISKKDIINIENNIENLIKIRDHSAIIKKFPYDSK